MLFRNSRKQPLREVLKERTGSYTSDMVKHELRVMS